MFFELIATFTAGVGAAGVVMLLRRLSGGRLAGWLTPVAAGVAMIAFTIWSEYAWYPRAKDGLPEGLVVASANSTSQVYRPWTYLVPMTNRFVAVDTATARTHPDLPGQRLVDVYLMGRWSPNRRVSTVLDCDAGRRADLIAGVTLGDSGTVPDEAWRDLPVGDPLLTAACTGEVTG